MTNREVRFRPAPARRPPRRDRVLACMPPPLNWAYVRIGAPRRKGVPWTLPEFSEPGPEPPRSRAAWRSGPRRLARVRLVVFESGACREAPQRLTDGAATRPTRGRVGPPPAVAIASAPNDGATKGAGARERQDSVARASFVPYLPLASRSTRAAATLGSCVKNAQPFSATMRSSRAFFSSMRSSG